jgi:hypothetical protein
VAALLGLLGDLLLRALPWGVNAPIWALALVVSGALLVYQARLPLLGGSRWLALPALFFAAGIAWRDSQALLMVNVLAVILTLGLAAHRAPDGWPRLGGLPQYFGALVSAGFHACGGALVLAFYDVHWRDIPRTGWSATVLAALRGLLIAIPLLVVFGALLMAADAVFSGLITSVLAINAKELFSHLFWLAVWSWLVAGFLRQLLFCTIAIDGLGDKARAALTGLEIDGDPEMKGDLPAEAAPEPAKPEPKPKRPGGRLGVLGIVELGVVLGLLDILFLAFVIVQFRYLFGGADLVQVSPTLTFAEYARRGFFELVTVAALLLAVMLFLDWLARLDRPREILIYRILAGLLGALLFVVIVSALQRMRLYTQEYGLTELRLYTTAFMFWITAGAIWYVLTVLRDQRERFLFGAMVAGLVVAGILDAINPDDVIVRTNAQRTDARTRFDGVYGSRLSSDAVPALVEALPTMPPDQQSIVARRLIERWEAAQSEDWRSWNYGRYRAFVTTAEHEATLRAAIQPSTRSSSRPGGSGSGGSRLDIPGPNDRP